MKLLLLIALFAVFVFIGRRLHRYTTAKLNEENEKYERQRRD